VSDSAEREALNTLVSEFHSASSSPQFPTVRKRHAHESLHYMISQLCYGTKHRIEWNDISSLKEWNNTLSLASTSDSNRSILSIIVCEAMKNIEPQAMIQYIKESWIIDDQYVLRTIRRTIWTNIWSKKSVKASWPFSRLPLQSSAHVECKCHFFREQKKPLLHGEIMYVSPNSRRDWQPAYEVAPWLLNDS
jgi:hypothetical protein